MRFLFDEAKAAEAAALFLQLHGRPMAYIKLIKLLYLADRAALIETGRTITGDAMVSMTHGPVLSRVYDCNTVEPEEGSSWHRYISAPEKYEVRLIQEPILRALSPYEAATISNVYKEWGHLDRWAFVKFVHTLPEWEDPQGSSRPIDPRVILREAGKSNEEIERIAAEVQGVRSFRMLASGQP